MSLGLALVSSTAHADDHLARMNEVQLAPVQFLEIEDPANETFSAGGYTLIVYLADGSVFPWLPAKGLTFTLMACADRVGSRLASRLG